MYTRAATPNDAEAIAQIYNQGIADRIATFETAPRSAADSDLVRFMQSEHNNMNKDSYPGADETKEDMSQENASLHGGIRGYAPAAWCAARKWGTTCRPASASESR